MAPSSFKSDLARSYAREAAIAAQHGLATSFDHNGNLRFCWLITAKGLRHIHRHK